MRCPLLNKDCIQAKCAWWAEFWMRKEPGAEPFVTHDCVVIRLPQMLIELLKNTGGIQAAVESRGNETIKRQDAMFNQQEILTRIMGGMAQISLERIGLPETKGVLGAGSAVP